MHISNSDGSRRGGWEDEVRFPGYQNDEELSYYTLHHASIKCTTKNVPRSDSQLTWCCEEKTKKSTHSSQRHKPPKVLRRGGQQAELVHSGKC